MSSKEPSKPDKSYYGNSTQYIKALKAYKKDRKKWLNSLKEKDPMVAVSQAALKKGKEYRKMRDSEFKRKQKSAKPQARITNFIDKKEDKDE